MESRPGHDETVRIICYLGKEGDDQNVCKITDLNLWVVRKGKPVSYELQDLVRLAHQDRKLIVPLVAGGIISTLSVLSITNFLFNPLLILIILFTGLGLFYYGWLGSQALNIVTKAGEYNVFIPAVSENLKAFTSYVNDNLPFDGSTPFRLFYHPMSPSRWAELENSMKFDLTGEKLYTYRSLMSESEIPDEHVCLVIDPELINTEIRFRMEDGNLVPVLSGNLAREAVSEILRIGNLKGKS